MNNFNIEPVKILLSQSHNIVITTHKSPDGDAMGSSLALYNFLQQQGHQVTVITPNEYPDNLSFLPGNEHVIVATKKVSEASEKIKNATVIFALDYNHLGRIDQLENEVKSSNAVKIMIDHHLQPDSFPTYTYSDTKASSTCEMIYTFISMLGQEDLISIDIAKCIYTGIMTDTGSFRFPASTAYTHEVAADLIKRGLKHSEIHEQIYDVNTLDKIQLVGYATCEKMKMVEGLKVAYIYLSQAELDRFNYKHGDTEGLVNIGLSIKGIKMAAFFAERDGIIKISFRSKGAFNVNEFSRNHFNGGGHANAAGGMSNLLLQNTVESFVTIIKQYKEQLV